MSLLFVFVEMQRKEEDRKTAAQRDRDEEEEKEGTAAERGGNDEEEEDDDDKDADDKKKKPKHKMSSCLDRKCIPGILYLGHIPPRLRPKHLRNLLSAYGEVGRIFLQPEGTLGLDASLGSQI